MKVRVGDTWIPIGVSLISTPGAEMAFIIDKESGMSLDRATASTGSISETRGAGATLKSGVVSAIKSKFAKNHLKPSRHAEATMEVEQYLGPAYKDAWNEDPNIIWET